MNDSAAYDFYASNLNVQQNLGYKPMQGSVKGGAGPVELRSVWQLSSGQRSLGTEPLGVEFLQGGEVIGAVVAALLLRSGLAEHNDPE